MTRDGLTITERRALDIIARRGPISCANLGDELWGHRASSNCSCPYARPAGRVVKSLIRRELVMRSFETDRTTRYVVTLSGRRQARRG